jgi:hypothetical protein
MKLRTPFLGFLGLIAIGLVAMQLLQGDLTVTAAATRIAIVALALTLIERIALPLARTLITTGQRAD